MFKYFKTFFSICLVLGITTSAGADEISGTWVANVDGNSVEMTFKLGGTTLTGTVDNSESGAAEIREGTVDGSKISFHVLRKLSGFGDSEFKITWSGEIIGDEILFKREFAGTTKGIIARRKISTSNNLSIQDKIRNDSSYGRLTGKWVLDNNLNNILELVVEGTSLTGTVDNHMGRAEITDGKIEDNKLSFHVIRQINLNEFNATWEGTIVGDEIHFDVLLTGSKISIIARKMVEKAETQPEQKGPQDTTAYNHLSGKWKANYAQGSMLMDFKIDGNKVTGTAGPKEFNQNEILDGKIENNKISFHVYAQLLNRRKNIWEGTIVGDKIRFTSQFPGGNSFNFIARKVEVDAKGKEKEAIQLPPTVDPSGTWVMEAEGKQITMSFKAVGMSVTGFIKIPPQNGTIMIPDVKVSGDTVSFILRKRIGPNLFPVPWVGKVTGNEIQFEGASFNQFESVTARKIKGTDGDTNEEPVKLVRDEEIKDGKVNIKYKKLRKKDSEYDFAMAYYDEYQYQFALPLLEQLYERFPEDAVLLHRLGVCLIMQSIYPSDSQERKGMRQRARGMLEKAKEQGMENELLDYYLKVIPEDGGEDDNFSNQKEVEELLAEGEKAFGLRDFHACIVLYARAMEMDPANYMAVLYVGDSYFANGQYKDALEWFERATKVDPDKETAWRFWGDCLTQLDKKDEGRLKYLNALIAEPYNRLSWNGIRNLINLIRRESKREEFVFKTPDIQRPQRLEASGELLVAEKNTDDSENKYSSTPVDGTEAWSFYNDVAREWRNRKYKEKFPDEEYRHTLEEEREALELVAEKVNESIKKGRIKSNDLNSGLKTLLELQSSGLLEPYILFHLADRDIIKEYPVYRKSNRAKLEQYLDRFEVPGTGNQLEL